MEISEIMTEFYKLPLNKQCKILYEALGYMQNYNGRSKGQCIALSMGYDSDWCNELNKEIYFKRIN